MSSEAAYKSDDPNVYAEWDGYLLAVEDTRERRMTLSTTTGRQLWVNRSGFSHGTQVIGFEAFDNEKVGDTIDFNGSKTLRVYKNGLVKPNPRSAAGKKFAAELRTYDSPRLTLPGMPEWTMAGDGDTVGLRVHSPAIFAQDGRVYAFWGCSGAPVDLDLWTKIPLSEYYTAKEKFDVEHE